MAQQLSVEIVDFEAAVVDVGGWVGGHEEAVVIDVVGAAVDVGEEGDVFGFERRRGGGGGGGVGDGDVEELGGDEVEV